MKAVLLPSQPLSLFDRLMPQIPAVELYQIKRALINQRRSHSRTRDFFATYDDLIRGIRHCAHRQV